MSILSNLEVFGRGQSLTHQADTALPLPIDAYYIKDQKSARRQAISPVETWLGSRDLTGGQPYNLPHGRGHLQWERLAANLPTSTISAMSSIAEVSGENLFD